MKPLNFTVPWSLTKNKSQESERHFIQLRDFYIFIFFYTMFHKYLHNTIILLVPLVLYTEILQLKTLKLQCYIWSQFISIFKSQRTEMLSSGKSLLPV